MVNLKINNSQFQVKSNISVLDACKFIGISIPRFCYHESLSIAGNCRMCLVELDKTPKPVASCVTIVNNGMHIYTDTPLVQKARESVVEMLLINHPLDCPICDQAGECDLQDQVKNFGNDYSRFFFNKRGVENKNCGPLIKTIMTRCIHCTRCVRFSTEVAGVESFGTLGRGETTEIGFYTTKFFSSEISGNVIDLCPVGALTAKPYAFKARPWELRVTESIDLTDGLGSNIFINFKETEIMRVLPKKNQMINESIISDKARFSYDSVSNQRLTSIYKNNKKINWQTVLKEEKGQIKNNLVLINSTETSLENLVFLKTLGNQNSNFVDAHVRSLAPQKAQNIYIQKHNNLKKQFTNLNEYSTCLLVSCNLRLENALINARIRSKFTTRNMQVFSLGQKFTSNVNTKFISLNMLSLLKTFEGKNKSLSLFLTNSKNILVILGSNLSNRLINVNLFENILTRLNSSSSIIKINLYSNTEGEKLVSIPSITNNDILKADNIFAFNLEDTIFLRKILKKQKKVFWLNPFGSSLAKNFYYNIPTNSIYEENGVFVNLEKRAQKNFKSLNGGALSLPQILLTLLNTKKLVNKNFECLKFLFETISNKNLFDTLNQRYINLLEVENKLKTNAFLYPIKSVIEDFYTTNLNTKNSITMGQCSQEFRKNTTNF